VEDLRSDIPDTYTKKGGFVLFLEKQFLPQAQRYVLSLIAFCLPLSIGASNVAMGLAFLVWGANLFFRPETRRWRFIGVEISWFIFLLITLLSALLSDRPLHSLNRFSSADLLLLFVLTSQLQESKDIPRNVSLFLIAGAVAGAWGFLQYVLGVTGFDFILNGLPGPVMRALATSAGRGHGFFSHPLTFAEVLLLAWTLCLGIYGVSRKIVFYGLTGVFILAGLWASGGRGVWIALVIVLALWATIKKRKELWVVLGAILLVGALALRADTHAKARLENLGPQSADASVVIRMNLWEFSLNQIALRPWLGAGRGNAQIRTSEFKKKVDYQEMVWTEMHNIYLQAAVEGGLLGLAALLIFLGTLGKILWRATAPGSSTQGWTQGLFWGYLGLLLTGLTESWTHDSEVMMALSFLSGMASLLPSPGGYHEPGRAQTQCDLFFSK
jgi:O-antigen ligase